MNLYRAYGLDVASERPLPLRPATAAGEPALTITYADGAAPQASSGPDRRELIRTDAGWTLRYDNREGGWMAFSYCAHESRLLVSGSVDWSALEGPLTGLAFGVLRRIDGESPLHGAALRIGAGAVAILGGSGHGKSTLAAALVALGAELLSEDLLLLHRDERAFTIEPGAPTLHLLDDSFRHLRNRLPVTGAPAAMNGDGKVRLILPAGSAEPVRLSAIYILEPPDAGSGTRMTQLSGADAVGGLTEQLYGSRWIRPTDAADLAFCAKLAAEVPVYALARPWALADVLDTAEMLRKRAVDGDAYTP